MTLTKRTAVKAKASQGHDAKPKARGRRSAGRLQLALDNAARAEITAALAETKGNVVHAARILGVTQPSLYRRLNSLGIEPDTFRSA